MHSSIRIISADHMRLKAATGERVEGLQLDSSNVLGQEGGVECTLEGKLVAAARKHVYRVAVEWW